VPVVTVPFTVAQTDALTEPGYYWQLNATWDSGAKTEPIAVGVVKMKDSQQ